MSEAARPNVYSIAAHRGFADALVAGLVPRYSDAELGLARLTLLLPSSRAMRTVQEALIRHYGAEGREGMLMPRMIAVGDLDLDEALGPLLDPLGAADIPPAVDPTYRWLRLAHLLRDELGKDAPSGAPLFRQAQELAQTMDRLLVEGIGPEELLSERVLDLVDDLSDHWKKSLRTFARMQVRWLAELDELERLDTASRRNRLFDHAAKHWRERPPQNPVVAAGVTSSSPSLARLLKVVSLLPEGAVVLPDFDLTMDGATWEELGGAGAEADAPFERGDAVTHPQYHLKLLLNRMGIAREEVQPWHRKGIGAAPPERSHAVSNLFLPPEASKAWVGLEARKRRLSGMRLMETANPEEEAQAIALLVREALDEPEKRVSVVTPDRSLARRIVHHLRRWNVEADDSAGQPLSQTPAGRLLLLVAEVLAENAAPVPLMALLQHPLVRMGEPRREWLRSARALERALRGPRPFPGLAPLADMAAEAGQGEWWSEVEAILAPLLAVGEDTDLADLLDVLASTGEALCGDALWSREDGRDLARFVEELRLQARRAPISLPVDDAHVVLRERMDMQAVRPPYGGHPRVAIYGLLESRMTRADLVICAGLNEGSWPATPTIDPVLAPPVLRRLGVPGADFRIGLAAHDLASLMGAPEVVLSRAQRDAAGPAIPSRFWLRTKALLGEKLARDHAETRAVELARALDKPAKAIRYEQPAPMPNAEQRKQDISVTALDRLRSDPYQFYASNILRLAQLDALDAEPTPAWLGIAAHAILEKWHKTGRPMGEIADEELAEMNAHPLMRALWQPRLMRALEWVEQTIGEYDDRKPTLFEAWGEMDVRGVTIEGKVDRIDTMEGGELAIVDYKTGGPPSGSQVEAGYALQLGTIGLMAQNGAFGSLTGTPLRFEYWSLAKSSKSPTGFGYVSSPVKDGRNRASMEPEEFLPKTEYFLHDALDKWILGSEPFTARENPDAKVYNTYDQLMRLEEWLGRET
ncbi:PD-(D/E)XK nuclease family protein [Erythrobacter sp. HKB08]|uniref:PD-(D/E)XK nuclease family protein n=1 Tax=Erythrobacter sp. HKB08 TaxID=2502843 RepID=UPI001008760B|nr:PD-(D/E)XK nuclease family protein [Erythrobacter sp. HKB08]